MIRVAIVIVTCIGATASAVEPLALDNGQLRIEIDPELFTVRFAGAPGGANLLAPLHIPQRVRVGGTDDVEPGGLSIFLIDDGTQTRVNGPAEVVEHTPTRLVLRSAPVGEMEIRVRLQCAMDQEQASCDFEVALETSSTTARTLGVVLRSVLSPEARLRLPKADATIVAVMPDRLADSLLRDAGDVWDVDPAVAPAVEPGTVDVDSTAMEIVGNRYALRRTAGESMTDVAALRLRYRRDVEKRQRIVDWLHPPVEVDLWNQPSIHERWQLGTEGD